MSHQTMNKPVSMHNSVATWVNLSFKKMGRSPKIFVEK